MTAYPTAVCVDSVWLHVGRRTWLAAAFGISAGAWERLAEDSVPVGVDRVRALLGLLLICVVGADCRLGPGRSGAAAATGKCKGHDKCSE